MAARAEARPALGAKPCPFCGRVPTIQYWHGGGRNKRMIGCDHDACAVQPQVTGSSKAVALARWNRRDGEWGNWGDRAKRTRKARR